MGHELRKEWSFQRLQFYTSGRLDVFFENFCSAGILLGYSIETSYKQLLLELGVSPEKRILNSHKTRDLHDYLARHYADHTPVVSIEFLEYVDDHLEARYPSQRDKVIRRIGDRLFVFGFQSLSFYDDLFFQLDQKCFEASQKDRHSSAYFRAGTVLRSYQGACFFHGNYLSYINREFIFQNLVEHGEHNDEVEILSNRFMELYSNQSFPRKAQDVNGVSFTLNFSSGFQYPKFDGKGAVLLNQVNFLAINYPLSS